MRVFEKLRAYIIENGIDISALAARCGMSLAELSAVLSGERRLYADELREICIALNLSPELFVEAASA